MKIAESKLSALLIDYNEIDIFIGTKVLEALGVKKFTVCKSVTEALIYLN